MSEKIGAVLVVGGGIAGVQAALDLAESGFKVYLLEEKPSIGGTMAQLDKTFPTNDCAMCILAPKLVSAARHPNIELLVYSELQDVKGTAGNFTAWILKKARYVDFSKCTGCGACAKKCPVKVKNEFDVGLTQRRAIYVPFPQAVPLKYVRDKNNCIKLSKGKECKGCTSACEAKAIKDDDKDEIVELKVGSVIFTPGFKPFDPRVKTEYGYGIFPNVVTSMEFERILAPTGPFEGHILRPSDKKAPKRIAFIQCVGSRDDKTNPYCSSVCCMYSIKEAIIAKEHEHSLDATIFFMDIRSFGKEFEYYYISAEKQHGIKFVRSKVAELIENPETKNITVRYTENRTQKEGEFDMVVLAVGMEPPPGMKKIADKLGIKLNKYSFSCYNTFAPLETSIPGIFVGGAFTAPKDIPDSVAQASGAASKASAIISSARGTMVSKKEYPPEKDVRGQEPRIGVFVCHCGINIGGVVDVPGVAEYAKTLPNVVYVDNNLFTCSQDTQKRIKEKIKEHNLNRIVVAACTPRTHEPLFRETCADSSLNPYLFEMANIRDQCSWVHMNEKDEATKKSKDLVRMAVAKARLLEPLRKITLPVTNTALIIGGGLSGMTAALELANQGFEVNLVEKERELGGNLKHIHYVLGGEDPQKMLKEIVAKVTSNSKIHAHLGTTVKTVDGFVGNFKTVLKSGAEFAHGVVIIAAGGYEYKPTEYLYGADKRVMTQVDFELKVAAKQVSQKSLDSVAMIQCVGCRDEKHPYCSRICCSVAIKNALKIKELNPESHVYVIYRDIRTYGLKEDFYREASQKGVIFLRYDDENMPAVTAPSNDAKLEVRLKDTETEADVILHPSILLLSAATYPNPDNEQLSQLLKVPITKDKFLLEAHMKLRPLDFATEGVFLCGFTHSPKFVDEIISQACGAAARAVTVISKKTIELEPTLTYIQDERCDGCAFCIDPCPYKALTLIEYMRDGILRKTVEVNESECHGCGVCMATCPKGSCYVRGFKTEQINAMIDAAVQDMRISEGGGSK